MRDITSQQMKSQIQRWYALYFDDSAENADPSQRLPVLIVSKLYKTVFSEYKCSIGGSQSEFLRRIFDRLDIYKNRAMQQCLIGGECFIKPVIKDGAVDFCIVRRDAFLPFARDINGRITDIGMCECLQQDGKYYTLLERRRSLGGKLKIENRLYCADSPDVLGVRVPLSALGRYAALPPEMELDGIYNLGMAPLRTPLENTVDGSFDAVSVYAPAAGLIENINRNEAQLNSEFENGASRIIVSSDLMRRDGHGRACFDDTLFTAVDDDPENVGINIFSPILRESSYIARKTEYLRNIESLIGMSRGLLSDVDSAQRTATEITSSQGDYNLTIIDFQRCWESAARELADTCVRLGRLYGIADSGDINMTEDIIFDFGDGVLYNRDKTWQEYTAMVQSGLLKPELALAWYFNLPCENESDMQKIRAHYMPAMTALVGGE